MSLGYSAFSIERWPEKARIHFFKHYGQGILACSRMPTDTFEQRVERAKAAIRLYFRCKVHVERMHPELLSQALEETAEGEGVG